MKRTLFFNENPMPRVYSRGTIPAKELRLRAALSEVDEVHVISLPGSYIQTSDTSLGLLEKKVYVHLTIPWPYYGAGIIHFIYGIYYIMRLRPIILEAESGIISGPAVVCLGKLFSIPTIVELRASYEELIKVHAKILPYHLKKCLLSIVTWFSYSFATALIANSKTYQRYLKRRGFVSTEINPGLQYSPEKWIDVDRQNIVCYLGRLVEEKGVDDLLHACASIKTFLREKKWKVWIVGDGVQRDFLARLVNSLEITDLVTFQGSQPNYETLKSVKMLVNPCFVRHPLEMVNVEAAWMHIPVICYGNDVTPETVLDDVTGVKVPYRDISLLAAAIKRLVLDESKRKVLGDQGHLFAKRFYSFTLQVKRLKKRYKELGIIS